MTVAQFKTEREQERLAALERQVEKKELLLHHGDVDNMEMVVVHIPSQSLRHSLVALISVHDRRQDKLLPTHNF